MQRIRAIMSSPWFEILIGLFLFGSGLFEVIHTFSSESGSQQLGAHHGATVYGLASVMRAASEILEGALKAEEAIADVVMLGEVAEENLEGRRP